MKILVPLDGSQLAEQVLPHAVCFARRFEAELHLLQVIRDHADPDTPFDGLDWELRCTRSACYLESVSEALAEQGIEASCEVIEGEPASEIIEFCHRHSIDLLILSASGAGAVARFPRGGTVQKIISCADLSLLLVNDDGAVPDGDVSYRHILVPVDGSSRSDWALSLAAAVATANDAELSLLHVIQEPKATQRVRESAEGRQLIERLVELNRADAARRIEEIKAMLPRSLTVSSRVVVAPDIPAAIEQAAEIEPADLVILSAHGSAASHRRPFGPVAEPVLAHTSRPVMILQDATTRGFSLKPAIRVPDRKVRPERRRSAEVG